MQSIGKSASILLLEGEPEQLSSLYRLDSIYLTSPR